VRELYRDDFSVQSLDRSTVISGSSKGRKKTSEAIIHNLGSEQWIE